MSQGAALAMVLYCVCHFIMIYTVVRLTIEVRGAGILHAKSHPRQISAVFVTIVTTLATPLDAVAYSFRWLLASAYEPLTGAAVRCMHW